MFCILDCDPELEPVLLDAVSTFPGTSVLERLGLRGSERYFDRMPRADAKLLAIEAPSSRDGYRCCFGRVGRGSWFFSPDEVSPKSDLDVGRARFEVGSAPSFSSWL